MQISTGFATWQRYCMASSSGPQLNFAALNRGRHLCSAGRPSRWALAHILVDPSFAVRLVIARANGRSKWVKWHNLFRSRQCSGLRLEAISPDYALIFYGDRTEECIKRHYCIHNGFCRGRKARSTYGPQEVADRSCRPNCIIDSMGALKMQEWKVQEEPTKAENAGLKGRITAGGNWRII